MEDSSPATNPPSLITLQNQAIKAALEARWEESLTLNSQIIKLDDKNIDALNRIARTNFELGNLTQADKYYRAVLEIDSYNPIAQKNIKIIQAFKKSGVKKERETGESVSGQMLAISPSLFLHEPGKTKTVNLLKVAEPQKLSLTHCGMKVELSIKNRGISVLDGQGRYLGVLPDDVSFQLLRLIKGGNKYLVCVKSVKVNGLMVLIRETFRSKRFRNQPSFLETPVKRNSEIVNLNRNDEPSNGDTAEPEESVTI